MIPKVVSILPDKVLIHLVETILWIQQRVLQEEGINQLHLAFLRRANHHREVEFSEIALYTGADKDAINRAARFLERSELAVVEPIPTDKRKKRLRLTPLGRKRLGAIERRFLGTLLHNIGYRGEPSRRAETFFTALWRASRFLPHANIADFKTYRPSRIRDGKLRLVELGPEKDTSDWSPDW